jgi:hypothetical protein
MVAPSAAPAWGICEWADTGVCPYRMVRCNGKTVGATPCGCPVGGARVNGVRRWADTEVCPYR